MPQPSLDARRKQILAEVLTHIDARAPLLLLKAPPGSGKTHVTVRGAVLAYHNAQRVAVATQTNAQADDLCRRLAVEFPAVPVHRFASAGYAPLELGHSVTWSTATRDLPAGPCVVVAVTAKWAMSQIDEPFDVMFVDEAWQMTWADFVVMGTRAASRFVLVGDPGQIAPVVPIDTARWQTSARAPHLPAPAVIARDASLPARWLELPVSTRLPADTAELVRGFYDFHFDAWAAPGERTLRVGASGAKRAGAVDAVVDRLTSGSIAMLAVGTPASGPPLEEDLVVAERAAAVARRLLERGAVAVTERGARELRPEDIGISATHRVMNTRIAEALGPELARAVRVDTPERWQGLERAVMIAVHPLSGVTHPSGFDLETGRLCVMASRHRVGLVLVGRDHIEATLEAYVPSADQAIGQADRNGRGHAQHRAVMAWLRTNDRVVPA